MMTGPDDSPPPDAIDIGDGHAMEIRPYLDEPAGIVEWHRKPDGAWCRGWVSFRGYAWHSSLPDDTVGWDVVKLEPLTLTPSILCRTCGNHGFITDGKWVKA